MLGYDQWRTISIVKRMVRNNVKKFCDQRGNGEKWTILKDKIVNHHSIKLMILFDN